MYLSVGPYSNFTRPQLLQAGVAERDIRAAENAAIVASCRRDIDGLAAALAGLASPGTAQLMALTLEEAREAADQKDPKAIAFELLAAHRQGDETLAATAKRLIAAENGRTAGLRRLALFSARLEKLVSEAENAQAAAFTANTALAELRTELGI